MTPNIQLKKPVIGLIVVVIVGLFSLLTVLTYQAQQLPSTSVAANPQAAASPPPPSPPTVSLDTLGSATATTSFSLDALNDTSLAGPPPMPIAVARGIAVTLRGWAVDAPNSMAAGGVIVSVDTTNYLATYGVERTDVATALANSAYRLCGFTITFPADMLAAGRHTLAIKVLTNDRKSYYQPDQKVDIEIGQSLDALTRLNEMTKFSIDSLNDTSFSQPPTAPIPVPRSGSIILRGWAVDTVAGTVAGGVIVSVDATTTMQAVYGVDRQDVADILGNPAYLKSGFNITIPASKLSPGTHTITIKILTNDRKAFYEPDQKVDIQVT